MNTAPHVEDFAPVICQAAMEELLAAGDHAHDCLCLPCRLHLARLNGVPLASIPLRKFILRSAP